MIKTTINKVKRQLTWRKYWQDNTDEALIFPNILETLKNRQKTQTGNSLYVCVCVSVMKTAHTREMQITTTVKYHSYISDWQKLKSVISHSMVVSHEVKYAVTYPLTQNRTSRNLP